MDHDERYRRMDEFLTICRAIWEGHTPFSFSGKYYTVKDATINSAFKSPRRKRPEIYLGAPSIALFGAYEEVAQAILNYKKEGITQFLLLGYPDKTEMTHFANGVLPIVRKLENS